MLVTTAKIKSLNPCASRLRLYLKHHAEFSGTMTQFLNLPNLTHRDKRWVYFRMVPREILPKVAADIAESVLHIFEAAHPKNKRPRLAIEAARSGVSYNSCMDAAYVASACARATSHNSAYAAAHAAFTSAATSHKSATSYAASCASAAALSHHTSSAKDKQAYEALQIKIMKRHLKKKVKK